jgi:hypothetical protein
MALRGSETVARAKFKAKGDAACGTLGRALFRPGSRRLRLNREKRPYDAIRRLGQETSGRERTLL